MYQPPPPLGDLRGMVRRHLVAKALAQLDATAAQRRRLRTPAAWFAYAAGVRRRFAAAVTHPALQRAATWRERPLNQRAFDGFGIENLLVESLPGCWMNVTVWKPDPRRWAPPWPAVVTPVGHNGKYNPSEQHPPQVFAANGFLSVSFDPPGFGEKARGNNHFDDGVRCYLSGINPLIFFLADALRAVDYALARPDVDGRGGVAMTGVSGGGFSSICGAVLDPRVTVIGPSCFGLADAIHPVRNGYACCPETMWRNRFGDGLGLEDLLVGARFVPMLAMSGRHDTVLTPGHFKNLMQPVRAAYAGAGVGDRLKLMIDECGHAYSVAQARAFVAWMRRWRKIAAPVRRDVIMPRKLELIPEAQLQGKPPFGLGMATAAARAARSRRRERDAARARRELGKLIPDWPAQRRRALRVATGPDKPLQLWVHTFQELSLRDGTKWELPAILVRPPQKDAGWLVFFDDHGRWNGLHQWGWLNRVAGVFSQEPKYHNVLSVDLPGWGETRPQPAPFDIVGWGGVDRWTGYVSAAVGESMMALRLRDAVRVLDLAARQWKISPRRIVVGGHGLGANIAGLAACLHGGLGGVLLVEPLAEFASLATAAKPIWPHDAYFPGILNAADLPEALALQPAPALVIGPRDARGRPLGARARQAFRGARIEVRPERFTAAAEPAMLAWLQSRR